MAKRSGNIGRLKPDTQLDSHFSYPERERRDCYVMGSADQEYGEVDGFRYGITSTGHRHRASKLGRFARQDIDTSDF